MFGLAQGECELAGTSADTVALDLFMGLLPRYGKDFKRIAVSMPNKVCLSSLISHACPASSHAAQQSITKYRSFHNQSAVLLFYKSLTSFYSSYGDTNITLIWSLVNRNMVQDSTVREKALSTYSLPSPPLIWCSLRHTKNPKHVSGPLSFTVTHGLTTHLHHAYI